VADIFDFPAAEAAAQRDYPEETKDIMFVDLSLPDAKEKLHAWYSNSGHKFTERDLEDLLKRPFANISCDGTKKILASNPKKSPSTNHMRWMDDMLRAKFDHFCFNHELGHLIIPGGIYLASQKLSHTIHTGNKRESLADCFAVLRGLQQKTLSADEVREISVRRSTTESWRGQYLTSRVIDEALIRHGDAGSETLTPEEIKSLVQKYAEKYAPSQNEVFDVADAFQEPAQYEIAPPQRHAPLTDDQWLQNVGDVCQKSPEDSFSFYISARILATALNTGEAVNFVGKQKKFNVTGSYWDKVRDDLALRLKKADAPLIKVKPPSKVRLSPRP
jgi:hypothetical protein